VVGLHEVRGRTVHADLAGAGLALDRVGREARAIRAVVDLDALVGEDVGRAQEVAVDRDRTFVVEIRLGDAGAVDLRLEESAVQGRASLARAPRSGGSGTSTRLSISRTAASGVRKRTASA